MPTLPSTEDDGNINGILNSMTISELEKVIEKAKALQRKHAFPFLDLPPELRNYVYSLVISPEDVKKHIETGKAPILLKVNRQISTEVQSLYYSGAYMGVEYYHSSTNTWRQERDGRLFQLILAKRFNCQLGRMVETAEELKERIGDPRRNNTSQYRGIFSWVGASGWCYAHVQYAVNVVERIERNCGPEKVKESLLSIGPRPSKSLRRKKRQARSVEGGTMHATPE